MTEKPSAEALEAEQRQIKRLQRLAARLPTPTAQPGVSSGTLIMVAIIFILAALTGVR